MAGDIAIGTDTFGVKVQSPLGEGFNWKIDWNVYKFDDEATRWLTSKLDGRDPLFRDFIKAGLNPYETNPIPGNLLTTAGLTRITSLITGGGGQALTNTSGRIGVGNGAGTAAVGDTDLSASAGSSNRWFRVFDATYPTVSAGVITAYATFPSADGNFAWNEFGIDIGTPTVTSAATVNATLLNHKTSIAQGTKTAGQTWTAQATITIA
jgi:hypothetical protein